MKNILLITVLIGTLLISCSKDDDNSIDNITCSSVAQIISENEFNEISASNYNVSDVELNGDCLNVTISSSGCDSDNWEMKLFSTDAFYTVFPLQRVVKIKLINNEACLAVFQKTVAFDLSSFQIDGQNQIPLNIEGWNEQIIYEY